MDMLKIKITEHSSMTDLKCALVECYVVMDKLLYLADQYEAILQIIDIDFTDINIEKYIFVKAEIADVNKQLGYEGKI